MELFDIVRGAKVALVGGAETIEESEIEKAHFVARVNSHWMRQGGRCEILYFSCTRDLDYRMFWNDEFLRGLKFVMLNFSQTLFGATAGAKTAGVIRILKAARVPFAGYYHAPAGAWNVFTSLREQRTWERQLSERYDFHPLTGILAIEHLLLSPAESVFVTGMDLYQSNGQLPPTAGTHSVPPQLRFLRDASTNPRLILDPCLKSILDNNPPED